MVAAPYVEQFVLGVLAESFVDRIRSFAAVASIFSVAAAE